MAFIFGGNTGMSYEEMMRQRDLASQLAAQVGQGGYTALGAGLASGILARRSDKAQKKGREEAQGRAQSVLGQLFGQQVMGQPMGGQPMQGGGAMPQVQYDPQSPDAIGAEAMAALGKPQNTPEWMRYSNQSATRDNPIDPSLVSAMGFLGDMGITMDVVSGGQEPAGTPGGKRTGSTRHDHGKSADVDFYKDGRKLDWNNPNDLPVLQQIVSTAKSRGVTGIGAGDDYMGPGRFHIGFGAPAVWGAGGKSANAPDWLVAAYNGADGGTQTTMSAQNAPPQPDMAALTAAMSDPYLDDGTRSVLGQMFQQQMQRQDPAYQIGMQSNQLALEKAQLELDQMRNPQAKPGYRTLSPQEAQQMGLPEGGVYQVSPEGQIEVVQAPPGAEAGGLPEYGLSPVWGVNDRNEPVLMQIGKDGTAIQTKLPEGLKPDPAFKAFETAKGSAEGKAAGEDIALLASVESKIPGLEQVISELDVLAEDATYTLAGQLRDSVGRQLGMESSDGAIARADYIAKVDNQILPMLRDTFGAAFTVKEGETLRATLGDPDKAPAEKQAVLRAFIAQKKRDLEALKVRTGARSSGGLSEGASKWLEE